MATIQWQCKQCRKWNQRPGIRYPTEYVRLACPGCKREHGITIYWRERREFVPNAVKASKIG